MVHLEGRDKARYVARMFARISRRYDLLNTVMTAGTHHRWRRAAAGLAAAREGPALDVATGTGDFALELARASSASLVVGLDIVPQMLELAQRKAQRRGLENRVHWVEGDALALPFPDATFVTVASGFGLRNVADLPQALREMARTTAPGGRVVALEITPFRGDTLFQRGLRLYFRHVVPWLGTLLTGDREAYAYLPQSVEGFPNADVLAGMLRESGLTEVGYRLLGLGTVALHWGTRAH